MKHYRQGTILLHTMYMYLHVCVCVCVCVYVQLYVCTFTHSMYYRLQCQSSQMAASLTSNAVPFAGSGMGLEEASNSGMKKHTALVNKPTEEPVNVIMEDG